MELLRVSLGAIDVLVFKQGSSVSTRGIVASTRRWADISAQCRGGLVNNNDSPLRINRLLVWRLVT
jgi:hypothetical protein